MTNFPGNLQSVLQLVASPNYGIFTSDLEVSTCKVVNQLTLQVISSP